MPPLIGQNRFCAISCNRTKQFCAISCYSTKRALCIKASLNQTVVCLSVGLFKCCTCWFLFIYLSLFVGQFLFFLIIVGSGSCVGLCVGGFQLQRCCFVILVIGRGKKTNKHIIGCLVSFDPWLGKEHLSELKSTCFQSK